MAFTEHMLHHTSVQCLCYWWSEATRRCADVTTGNILCVGNIQSWCRAAAKCNTTTMLIYTCINHQSRLLASPSYVLLTCEISCSFDLFNFLFIHLMVHIISDDVTQSYQGHNATNRQQ